jgi:hypothetical protein
MIIKFVVVLYSVYELCRECPVFISKCILLQNNLVVRLSKVYLLWTLLEYEYAK